MRIVATKFFQQGDIDFMRRALPDVDFWFPKTADDLKSLNQVVNGATVLLGPPPTAAILAQIKDTLQLVQIPWSGVDGMDFTDCHTHSITCANSHTNATSVAELAISLCLDVLKATPFHDAEFRQGKWHRPGSDEGFFPPRLLSGRSVGILGYGAIGRDIHRLLAGFDVDVATTAQSGSQISGIKTYDRATQFADFLVHSEILFVAAPLTSQTVGIINHSAFSKMQKTSVVINVSRAELIDVSALYTALLDQRISGAAFDVHWRHKTEEEQHLVDEIVQMKNVVLSPHRGGFVAGELPHLAGAIENIRHILAGRLDFISGKIDLERGY
jgi:phosphoglycerate dehydrogenase-like enzyme